MKAFQMLNAMLNELKDGHVSLIAPFNAASNRSWYFNYPTNYNANIIDRNYLQGKPPHHSALSERSGWRIAQWHTSGIRVSPTGFSGESMTELFKYYGKAKGWIIDIRDNTGGSLGNVDAIMKALRISRNCAGGAVRYKLGLASMSSASFSPT